MGNKGKVYPSPSLSPAGDFLSVLKLLPAAILAFAAALSLEDREVLAYMITRSINSTNPSPSPSSSLKNKKKSSSHKAPIFDCDCFDCYTSYWFKWDSSPNRELIHQAIEAFEDHLNNGEQSKKKYKKRDKMGHRRLAGKPDTPPPEALGSEVLPEFEVSPVEVRAEECAEALNDAAAPPATAAEEVVTVKAAAASHHKGLARKVLPDVLGLFNSRLWSLWSPNI